MGSRSRVSSQIIHMESEGASSRVRHKQKLAFYAVGSRSFLEYLESPYIHVTHILISDHQQQLVLTLNYQGQIQIWGQHSDPWKTILLSMGSSRVRALNNQVLFRAEVRVFGEDEIKNLARCDQKDPMVLVMDHVQDPRNMGAMIRSAAFFGVRYVVVAKDRQAQLTETVIHCSRGGLGYVKIVQVVNIARCLMELKKVGYWIVGAHMDGEDYQQVAGFYSHMALVVGQESKGLSKAIEKKCDKMVRISGSYASPATIRSLNVSVACGILMCGLMPAENITPSSIM